VIITHWHEDHSGGARLLSEELGLPVYIHRHVIDKVRRGYSYPDYRVLAWGEPFESAPAVCPLDVSSIKTKTGKYTFDLLHLPGHSDDLIVLIEPTKNGALCLIPLYLNIK
jgi:ribonuclease/clavin/mitogillin